MNKEQWIKWEPIPGLYKMYDITDVINDEQGFTILMENLDYSTSKAKIFFENHIDAYRCTEECYRLNISDLFIQPDGKNIYGHWSFFKAIHSSYLHWLKQESSEFFDVTRFTHFVFFGKNSIIDVAANYEPTIILGT